MASVRISPGFSHAENCLHAKAGTKSTKVGAGPPLLLVVTTSTCFRSHTPASLTKRPVYRLWKRARCTRFPLHVLSRPVLKSGGPWQHGGGREKHLEHFHRWDRVKYFHFKESLSLMNRRRPRFLLKTRAALLSLRRLAKRKAAQISMELFSPLLRNESSRGRVGEREITARLRLAPWLKGRQCRWKGMGGTQWRGLTSHSRRGSIEGTFPRFLPRELVARVRWVDGEAGAEVQ